MGEVAELEPANEYWVAGVDGCRSGWIVVLRPLSAPAAATLHFASTFSDVLQLTNRCTAIGIDMPIGLPEISGIGGRLADREARANLGARQSAVFAVPSRAAVMEQDYREACAVALATSSPPRKVSKQCFHLFPRIREIDALMTPPQQDRIFECHPELGFWALNNESPLDQPKKVKSQPHPPGLELRRALLEAAEYSPAFLRSIAGLKRSIAGEDDLLDACACSWSAARILRGNALRFPDPPPLDARGLRMEIWC